MGPAGLEELEDAVHQELDPVGPPMHPGDQPLAVGSKVDGVGQLYLGQQK